MNTPAPMTREPERLGDGPFDVLVVGGGIYGAWIAYDAALRGLSVALVEARDWGSGTSQSSSKLIHGGLRYLEQFHFGLVRRALGERRRLAEMAPHRVHPLRFVLPLFRGDRVGRLRLEAGLWLYDRLAGGGQPVPPHRAFSRRQMLDEFGFLAGEGLKCGFSYGDCGTDDARFTLEVVAGAQGAGAVCVNRARVTRFLKHGERISGAVVHDLEGDREYPVNAAVTINAAGPWAGCIDGPGVAHPGYRLVKGVHLTLPALPVSDAFLLTAKRDGRVFFLIPWYGRTLVGTTDNDYDGDPGEVSVTSADVEYLLSEVATSLGISWTEDDIQGAFAGVRTLQDGNQDSPTEVTREWSLERPAPGLLVPVGGKFTSSRAEAAITVAAALELMDRPPAPCPTKRRRFPWAPEGRFSDWFKEAVDRGVHLGLDPQTAAQAARRYGTTVEALHGIVAGHPDMACRIVPELAFCRGELVHAVRPRGHAPWRTCCAAASP